jgi:hypothetical protein
MRFAGNRMLKRSSRGILASLRGSTLKRIFRSWETLAELIHSPRPIIGVNGYTKCGLYLLSSPLATALPGTGRIRGRRGCLADSGLVGEVAARAGQVRSLALMSILNPSLINGKSKVSTMLNVSINFFRSQITPEPYATE